MKLALSFLFALTLALGLVITPAPLHACETYEQPCGGNEDRTGDDRRDSDPVVVQDDDRQDNDPGYPSF